MAPSPRNEPKASIGDRRGRYVGAALCQNYYGWLPGHGTRSLFVRQRHIRRLSCNTSLREVRGDIRDQSTVELALKGCKSVIHLACISNDPSFELNPKLGKSINFDAFRPLVQASKRFGVERLIYASSSSVYGIKDDPFVTEELPLEPLTDYSKYKALCETVLEEERSDGFTTLIIRPATVCGFTPRLRLDLTVNILTNQH